MFDLMIRTRTGSKVHAGAAGWSTTRCGHWLKYGNGEKYVVPAHMVTEANLCERCFPNGMPQPQTEETEAPLAPEQHEAQAEPEVAEEVVDQGENELTNFVLVPSRRALSTEEGASAFMANVNRSVPNQALENAQRLLEDVRARRDENEAAWSKLWNAAGTDCKATTEQTVAHNRAGSALTYAMRAVFKRFPELRPERPEAEAMLEQAREQLEGLRAEVEQLLDAAEPPRQPKRLLVMACSATKRADKGRMPALERYDGPSYRVLRNFLAGRSPEEAGLAVVILSAEFGLIPWDMPIPDYDTRMNGFRAKQLEGAVRRELRTARSTAQPTETFLMMGKDYLEAIGPLEGLGFPENSVVIPEGGIGHKLGALKAWLEGRVYDAA